MIDRSSSVAIVGGGLAGLAAAVAAVERGLRVDLFEATPSLGGRASSFIDSRTGECVDHCQHVAMGCCKQFLGFCRQVEIDDCFARCKTLHFIGPDGQQHDFTSARWLPVPLHLLPGVMKLDYLSLRERWGIIRTLRHLCYGGNSEQSEGSPLKKEIVRSAQDDLCRTIADWLRREKQSDRAIDRFWSPVLVGALGETVDHASLSAARKVFRDGFAASRDASDLLIPRLPLRDIFHNRLRRWLTQRGAEIYLSTPVKGIEMEQGRFRSIVLCDGGQKQFDAAIVAVAWRNLPSLLSDEDLACVPSLAGAPRIEPAGITAVHLWFDRHITNLSHAVLIGRLSQWMFARSLDSGGQHCQVVISASHRLRKFEHDELVSAVRQELEAVWTAARDAHLLAARVITQPWAVFSMMPEVDRFRPPQRTPIAGLALAGDWTATGWPATMEGAVSSGYRAVAALCNHTP